MAGTCQFHVGGSHPGPVAPPGALLTSRGRHALGLVARELRGRGVRLLVGPEYHCATMYVPFQLEGIAVRNVETGRTGQMRGRALLAALAGRPDAAVLHCATFGIPPDPDLRAALATAHAAGHPLILDETHAVLDPAAALIGPPLPDYRVASLRKLLPLPDGAWVTGLHDPPVLPRGPADDESWTPTAISPAGLAALAGLDIGTLAAVRRRTARRLAGALTGIAVVAAEPCGVVVSHPRGDRLGEALAAEGIEGTVQWGRPEGWPRSRAWRSDLVTLPVDEGLDDDAVAHVAARTLALAAGV